MKKMDLILIGAIIAVIAIAFCVVTLTKKDGAYVVVKVDGEQVAKYSLTVDGEYELNGGTNILKIEDGKAWMIYGNCPKIKGDCTKDGKISRTNEYIACVPNRLLVIVYGADADDSVDFVVG